MPLHLGLILPNYGEGLEAERLAACAVAAEESGFDSGWVTDHLVVPEEHAPIYGSIAEALVSLGFLAGRTQAAAARRVGPDRPGAEPARRAQAADDARLPLGRPRRDRGRGRLDGGRVRDARSAVRRAREGARRVARPRCCRVRADARTRALRGRATLGRRLARAGARATARALGRRRLARDLAPRRQDRRLAPGRALGGRAARARREASTGGRCSASARTSPTSRRPARTSAAVTRSRARPSGSPSGWPSTSRRAATGSSSTSATTSPELEDRARRFGAEVAPLLT